MYSRCHYILLLEYITIDIITVTPGALFNGYIIFIRCILFLLRRITVEDACDRSRSVGPALSQYT
jgi:hypothetical protein